MKIYVAAAFAEKDRASALMDALQQAGHSITHDWTKEDAGTRTGPVELAEFLRTCAEDDQSGVEECEALVLLASDAGRASHTELGMALALGTPVFVLNSSSVNNIFFHLRSVIRVSNTEDLLDFLTLMKWDLMKWAKT